MRALFGCIVAASLLAAPAWAQQGCRGQGHTAALPYPVQRPAGYEHERFAPSRSDLLLDFGSFVSSFDSDDDDDDGVPDLRAVPEWVAYEVRRHVDAEGAPIPAGGLERPSNWYELKELSFVLRQNGVSVGKLDDSYRGVEFARQPPNTPIRTGDVWNRGHLATRSHMNRISDGDGCNSHVFANAVPQFWAMNQGDWVALERYVGALANKVGRVWTVSGPLFSRSEPVEVLGEPGEAPVAIPHGLFKIIFIETDGKVQARSFVFPQPRRSDVKDFLRKYGTRPSAGYRHCEKTPQEEFDFIRFAVSLDDLEARVGLGLLARVPEAERDRVRAESTTPLWPVPLGLYEKPCGPGSVGS